MNVAKLELSKELREVSGWDGTSYRYYVGDGYDGKLMDEHYWSEHFADECIRGGDIIPAYDSGYLLRKLPTHHNFGVPYVGQTNGGTEYVASFMNWWAMWEYDGEGSGKKWHQEVSAAGFLKLADTPEDALCKLAIELFKQGVLSKESDT